MNPFGSTCCKKRLMNSMTSRARVLRRWAVGFAVANQDDTVFDLQDSGIGEGYSEDVGGKVFEACFTGAYGLGIDVPLTLPDLRGDLIEEWGFSHCISELGLKDFG